MKNIAPKTIEEHRNYLYEVVKLKLFFLHRWMAEHPDEKFEFVLQNRVDIYRSLDAKNWEEWGGITFEEGYCCFNTSIGNSSSYYYSYT